MSADYIYKRVLLKISGESLKGKSDSGYDAEAVRQVVEKVRAVVDHGIEVALVCGAGNVWRGVNGTGSGMDRVTADYMGMLATVMNALCLRDAFAAAGVAAEIFCAFNVSPLVELYSREKAVKALEAGRVVIFAGGTGSPFFTTDTTATLRALETGCEAVLKATKVDGIYTADPFKDPSATRFETISFADAINRKLKVMDSTAFSMCSDNAMPIIVFNFSDPDCLEMVLRGDTSAATVVS